MFSFKMIRRHFSCCVRLSQSCIRFDWTCLQVELRKLSWEQEKYTRCNRKPSSKHGVGERKLAAGPPTTEKVARFDLDDTIHVVVVS